MISISKAGLLPLFWNRGGVVGGGGGETRKCPIYYAGFFFLT